MSGIWMRSAYPPSTWTGTTTFDGDLEAIHASCPGIGNRENGWRTCDVDRWLATANPQAAQGQQHPCHSHHSPVALTANRFWATQDLMQRGFRCTHTAPLESDTQLSSRRWRWWRFYRAWLSEISFQEITTELFFIDNLSPEDASKSSGLAMTSGLCLL